MEKRPTEEQLAKYRKNAQDQSLSAEVRAKFQAVVDKFSTEAKKVEDEIEGKAEPKKRGRKPATATATKKPTTKGGKKSVDDIEKAKAEIKRKTGKTEEECESIIEQYRALRTKAQEGKRKAEQASAENKKRVEKLDKKGDLIEGTTEKTADAVIESTAKDVAEKIEQQIEAVEEKAEKQAKAEVEKDKTIKTPKAKKEAVEAKVEKKVKAETKVVVKRVVVDTSALLTSIAESLGKFDKDSQKEFLIKLRSDIDKLLAKYSAGGLTDGATQVMNIQQSNLSASSVNPTLFAKGGGVGEKITKSRLKAKLYKPTGDFLIEDKGDKWFLHFTPKDASKNSSNLSDLNAKSVGNGYYGSAYSVDKLINHKYEDGGVIGQEIVFDDNGEENTGVIKDIHENTGDYIVATDDGRVVLASRELDVISLGKMRENYNQPKKKLFGIFAKGGGVSDLEYNDILAVLEDKLTEAVANDIPNDFENAYNASGEEVEHQSRDGFIAYTDGGFQVRWFEYLSQFYSSGNSLPTSALDKEKDRQIEYNFQLAKERFTEEYPEIVEELGEENIDYHSLQEAGYESEAEELSEMEMDFDGEETIMCEVGAYYYSPSNDRGMDGEHTLRLFGLVNLESPYHRSGNLEDRYDIDITFNSIEELEEQVEAGLKEITDWFNGSHYNESTKELRIRRMAKGGMTEHGLRVGDTIVHDFGDDEIMARSINNDLHRINLDKGERFAKGGNVAQPKIGDILTAKTGVKLKVVNYDPLFGGRVKVVRMDKYSDGKTSQWMPLSKFESASKIKTGGNVSSMLRNRRGM